MGYAEVCVNSPVGRRQTFSYAIPPSLNITEGQAVVVPFGAKQLQGIVLALSDAPSVEVEKVREIAGIIDSRPVLSTAQISLAYWISRRYLSPLFDAVALMLPPGFEQEALTYISPLPGNFDLSSLPPTQKMAFDLIRSQPKINLKELEKILGKKKAQSAVSQLVKHGLVSRSYELPPIRTKAKTEPYVCTTDTEKCWQEIASLREKRARKQADLLEFLARQFEPVSIAEIRQKTGIQKATINALVQKGLASIQNIGVRRNPLSNLVITPSEPLALTAAQKSAFTEIQSSLIHSSPDVFLLHGVTGSGKTEVYLQALAEAIRLGKKGIVLVPEISLTPQTIERFASRFPNKVAVLHSQLSPGEQFDEWHRIRNGEADVVIGPRSALFAPQPNLGLIVIDEEHEWTYKQGETSPRYHAREAAIKLAGLSGATVILGSATPDVESYYRAQRGEYTLLRLPERVTPRENSPLPEVEVVDLRSELKTGNRSLFSRPLSGAIDRAIAGKEQVILFLNRRGASTFVQCRKCGFVMRCRRCDIPLTYHVMDDTLVCHQCNYKIYAPRTCPECGDSRIKFLGSGTQKLEQEARLVFPSARLLRWDSDTTQRRNAHAEILNRFREHKSDILIGTQMVTKGLDLPGITLVGVINADTALNLPDFRSGERTFQLLCQVAGRAGRGILGGKVIIQTYSPDHYAVQAAAGHNYRLFYEKEIGYRRQLNNPPFSRLAKLVFHHPNETACRQEAERMNELLIKERDSRGIADITLVGPAPAFIHRLRGRFRWQIIVRSPDPSSFLAPIDFPQGWTINIDPVGLL